MSLARLDLAKGGAGAGGALVKRAEVAKPPGYVVDPDPLPPPVLDRLQASKEGAAWNISTAPGKALLQTAFMLWMSGSSIQIFSIYATGNALISPLRGLVSVNEAFKQFEEKDGINLFLPKVVFCSLQVLALGVALYKCSTMGLLPLTSADWTGFLPEKLPIESSGTTL